MRLRSHGHLLLITGIIFLSFTTTLPASSSLLPHFFPNASSSIHNATASAWEPFKKLNGCRPGEKLQGLDKLKQYFHNFGYIDDDGDTTRSNFTDEFDDGLETAVRTYQRNFNLNETGQLDDPTIRQITLPRCGVADIINGITSMNSGKLPLSPPPAALHFRTVAHYSFFPSTPVWPAERRQLTYAFLPGNDLADAVRSVFSRAFQRWSAVTPLTFTETTEYDGADIKIGFYSGEHGDGEAFDGALGTLAHAFSPPSGRLHLDGEESWVVERDVSEASGSSAVDLESVAVHEIGHLLGLGHSSVEEAIMYPTISSKKKKVELTADDVGGIQYLYGGNPTYNATEAAATRRSETTASSGGGSGDPLWGLRALLIAIGAAAAL